MQVIAWPAAAGLPIRYLDVFDEREVVHEKMMIALNFCWPIYFLARPIGGEYLQECNSPTTSPTSIAESIDT